MNDKNMDWKQTTRILSKVSIAKLT